MLWLEVPHAAVPAAPDPLETYAAQFDDLFTRATNGRPSASTWPGLLLPPERHKTLTALANVEPVVGARRQRRSGCSGFS